MTDRLVIRGLRAHGYHGVLDQERVDGQPFVVDAVLEVDAAPAAKSDRLDDAVDYASLIERLVAIVTGPPVALIETLAEQLAAECLRDNRVASVELTVHKPHAPVSAAVDDVAVTVLRHR